MPLKDTSQGCPPIAAASAANARWPLCSASNLPSATTGERLSSPESGRCHALSAWCGAADLCVSGGRTDACCALCGLLGKPTVKASALPIAGCMHEEWRGGVAE